MMRVKYSILMFFCFLISAHMLSQHKLHTDGIEPYYHPVELENYLKTIDKGYLPYMFASDEDMQWWKEAKFGIFVHWAPSVVTEVALSWGRHGRRPHHPSDGTVSKGVAEQAYNDTYKTFDPVHFDAEEWVVTWKKAGARYFVFTAKHHYGFCMWDTKTTDFNIMNTPYGKDVMKDIAEACEKHDMRLMWYYSQPDWTHPLYREELPHTEYNEQILYPQMAELMSYPGIDGIWFDGLGLPPARWDSPKLLKMIREVNPEAIVNHRHGTPQWHMGDFDGPERGVGRFQVNRPWETCDVMAGAWAYNGESVPAPLSELIRTITKTAGNGGNLLLGTGPRPDGTIVDMHAERLEEIGAYLDKYGESIYATQGGPYISGPWGSATCRNDKVYLHLSGRNNGGKLLLPQLPAKVIKYQSLTSHKIISMDNGADGLSIVYEKSDKDLFPIIELTLNTDAQKIHPLTTTGILLLNKAAVTASSDRSDDFSSQNLLPGAGEDFSEGIRIKKSWRPQPGDEKPELIYSWDEVQTIAQISIKEGRRLKQSDVEEFRVQAWYKGGWQTVYRGSSIGSFCGIVFNEAVATKKLRIVFEKQKNLEINKVLIYTK
ncbi:alpha-L-fucosidase [Carboxylicivirga sp. RSCT41]|uniref:alpha-L-fucosidase n=1 Tax=Carboxylicivirga agarovorans TaxID=3417570 RepID=UPI003D325F60